MASYAKRKVSDNLGIAISDAGVGIYSTPIGMGVPVSKAELPRLLAALNAAAEEMGIPTAYAALLAFAQDFKAFILRDDYESISDEEYAQCMNELSTKAWAALAKAEQQ